jgi:hypothetical protein
MGTVSFQGVKRPGLGVDHLYPSSAEVEGRVQLYQLLLHWASVACPRVKFILNFIYLLTLYTSVTYAGIAVPFAFTSYLLHGV